MTEEPPKTSASEPTTAGAVPDHQPRTRREARELAARQAAASGLAWDHHEEQTGTSNELAAKARKADRVAQHTAAIPVIRQDAAAQASAPTDEPASATAPVSVSTATVATDTLDPPVTSIAAAGRETTHPAPRRRGRGRRAWTIVIVTLVILALLGGGAAYAWHTFQPQVKAILGRVDPPKDDYTGSGTGTVQITIKQGDTGADVAKTLAADHVTMTSQAFYSLLLQTTPAPVFQPGVYRLREHMSAAHALALLQNPDSKIERTLLIKEGESEPTVLQGAATATGIPLAQLQAAAKSPSQYGLPAQATTLEGFLFPATYQFNPGITAQQVITTLVNRAKQAYTADGVPASKLWNTVILASIVQREAGPNPPDLGKIARVFVNRMAQDMPLQSDATVAYGTGHTDTVWTTPEERADASNPYNTYAHQGLPIGPIGNPGDAAIAAALQPTPGTWLYFTVVNLKTGETAFSQTETQHEKAAAQLQTWCAQAGNAQYCG